MTLSTPISTKTSKMNDNSNPQQGTGGNGSSRSATRGLSARPSNHHHRGRFKVPPTQYDARKLFVGGLPSNITQEEFYDFFSAYGDIVDAKVMFDRDTLRSRGFGFVTFCDENVALELLHSRVEGEGPPEPGVGRLSMRGKLCEIKAAQPKGRASEHKEDAAALEQSAPFREEHHHGSPRHHSGHPHNHTMHPDHGGGEMPPLSPNGSYVQGGGAEVPPMLYMPTGEHVPAFVGDSSSPVHGFTAAAPGYYPPVMYGGPHFAYPPSYPNYPMGVVYPPPYSPAEYGMAYVPYMPPPPQEEMGKNEAVEGEAV